MARTHTWWTQGLSSSNLQPPASVDLLEGSLGAFQGATLQRLIGRVDVAFAADTAASVIRTIFGILVTDTPDPAILSTNTSVDYLWFVQFIPDPRPVAAGDFVGSLGFDTITSWDVAGPRIIGTGESVWLLYDSNFVAATPGARFSVGNRALMLDAPV